MGRAQVWDGLTWVPLTGSYADEGGGGGGDHALLTNVTASQHHVRYSDAEALAANAGEWLPLIGGTINGNLTANVIIAISRVAISNADMDYDLRPWGPGTLVIRDNDQGNNPMQINPGNFVFSRLFNMGGNQITNMADGTSAGDAVNRGQLDQYLPLSGGSLTGRLVATAIDIGVGTGDVSIENARVPSLGWRDAGGGFSGFSRFGENQVGFYNGATVRTIFDNLGIVSPAIQNTTAGNTPNLVIVPGTDRIARSTATLVTQEMLDPLLAAVGARLTALESL